MKTITVFLFLLYILNSNSNNNVIDHSSWNNLLKKHVTASGKVNYKGFKADTDALQEYINYLGANVPNNTYSKEEKLAYWINAYNALTVDLIIRNHPIKSIKDIKKPWQKRLWHLGGKWYNLETIEHQILRKMNEPRIHFAIVCASVSCPKLQNHAYESSTIELQLTNATKEFLADKSRNELTKDSVKISKIFDWFSKDFKSEGSVINFINKFSDVNILPKSKISFKDYNWRLND